VGLEKYPSRSTLSASVRRTMAQQPPYPLRDRLAQWGVQPVIPPAAAEA
jgi:hypothetical protein